MLLAAVIAGGALILREYNVPDAPDPPALPGIQPSFGIAILRNEITLEGHVVSGTHASELLSIAADAYPGHRLTTDFATHDTAPDHWYDTTIQLLYALATAESASARLDDNTLSLKTVTREGVAWRSRFAALTTTLPPEIVVTHSTIEIPVVEVDKLCGRASNALAVGPIRFEESTDQLRRSAYPELERVAALADACRDLRLQVTGHTDSSGNESVNRSLSLQRARAVARYLEKLGIESGRIDVLGAGSSEPIATNETRYGRSLNRRIEIAFAPAA